MGMAYSTHARDKKVLFWSNIVKGKILGTLCHWWENNIKINLKEILLKGLDWINLVQCRTGGALL
jgi:hypothetical protein